MMGQNTKVKLENDSGKLPCLSCGNWQTTTFTNHQQGGEGREHKVEALLGVISIC